MGNCSYSNCLDLRIWGVIAAHLLHFCFLDLSLVSEYLKFLPVTIMGSIVFSITVFSDAWVSGQQLWIDQSQETVPAESDNR